MSQHPGEDAAPMKGTGISVVLFNFFWFIFFFFVVAVVLEKNASFWTFIPT